jgi:endogenous inhibitor of DNA gyrase (YacG/DUF329 family)
MGEKIISECKHCGRRFEQERGMGPKFLYCSEQCRVDYWLRQDHEQRQAAHAHQPEKACANCGRQFREAFGRGHRQKFCCDRCRREYHTRPSEGTNLARDVAPTCPHCGRQFLYTKESGGRRRKFCCDECRLAYWRVHQYLVHNRAMSVFRCKHCGRDFEGYGSLPRSFCSKECLEAHRETLNEEIICPVCGKVFTANKKKKRKYCSKVCTGIARTKLAVGKWGEISPPQVEIKRGVGLLPPEVEPLEAPGLDDPVWILPALKLPKRIILVCQPLCFWNGWVDFLAVHIQSELGMNPLRGDIFVFCNGKHTELRLLQWSGAGFEILSKKLGYGHFPWPTTEDAMKEIDESDFRLLLEYPRFLMRLNEQRVPEKYVY